MGWFPDIGLHCLLGTERIINITQSREILDAVLSIITSNYLAVYLALVTLRTLLPEIAISEDKTILIFRILFDIY